MLVIEESHSFIGRAYLTEVDRTSINKICSFDGISSLLFSNSDATNSLNLLEYKHYTYFCMNKQQLCRELMVMSWNAFADCSLEMSVQKCAVTDTMRLIWLLLRTFIYFQVDSTSELDGDIACPLLNVKCIFSEWIKGMKSYLHSSSLQTKERTQRKEAYDSNQWDSWGWKEGSNRWLWKRLTFSCMNHVFTLFLSMSTLLLMQISTSFFLFSFRTSPHTHLITVQIRVYRESRNKGWFILLLTTIFISMGRRLMTDGCEHQVFSLFLDCR